jgi:hypothetical protein
MTKENVTKLLDFKFELEIRGYKVNLEGLCIEVELPKDKKKAEICKKTFTRLWKKIFGEDLERETVNFT